MYRDADEVESFRAEALVTTGSLQALLEHLGITTAPRYRIKEVPHPGWVEFKDIAEILDTVERVTRNKVIKMCKVQWNHHTKDEAT
jgi:hypothetical protein